MVQLVIDQALGVAKAVNDPNGDGVVNVVDVSSPDKSRSGLGCAAKLERSFFDCTALKLFRIL
jgi:hypothetical protein